MTETGDKDFYLFILIWCLTVELLLLQGWYQTPALDVLKALEYVLSSTHSNQMAELTPHTVYSGSSDITWINIYNIKTGQENNEKAAKDQRKYLPDLHFKRLLSDSKEVKSHLNHIIRSLTRL